MKTITNKLIPQYPFIAVELKKYKRMLKSEGGIVLPIDNEAKEEKNTGVVYAHYGKGSPVRIGDKVIFKKFAGEIMNFEDKDIIIMPDTDLLATF